MSNNSWLGILSPQEIELMRNLDIQYGVSKSNWNKPVNQNIKTSRVTIDKPSMTSNRKTAISTSIATTTSAATNTLPIATASLTTTMTAAAQPYLSIKERQKSQKEILGHLRERAIAAKVQQKQIEASQTKSQLFIPKVSTNTATMTAAPIADLIQPTTVATTTTTNMTMNDAILPTMYSALTTATMPTTQVNRTPYRQAKPAESTSHIDRFTRTPAKMPTVSDALLFTNKPESAMRQSVSRRIPGILPDVTAVMDQLQLTSSQVPSAPPITHPLKPDQQKPSSTSNGSAVTKPAKFPILSALLNGKPISKLRPMEASGRPVRINLGQTRLCITEDPTGIVHIDLLRNGKRAATAPTKVVLRKETVLQTTSEPMKEPHYIDSNTTTSKDATFVTANSHMIKNSLWSQSYRPPPTPLLTQHKEGEGRVEEEQPPPSPWLTSSLNNEDYWKRLSLVMDQLPTSNYGKSIQKNHLLLENMNQSLWDDVSSVMSNSVQIPSIGTSQYKNNGNLLNSRYFNGGDEIEDIGEESGLASRYFLSNHGRDENGLGGSMLASKYFKEAQNTVLSTKESLNSDNGNNRLSEDGASGNSWPLRPLHEASPIAVNEEDKGIQDRLQQSRLYAENLQSKINEQSARVDRLEDEKRHIIGLVSEIMSNSSLPEDGYVDEWLPVKERRLAKIRQVAENLLEERQRQQAMISRLQDQESKIGQLMKALSHTRPTTATATTTVQSVSDTVTNKDRVPISIMKPTSHPPINQQHQRQHQYDDRQDEMDWIYDEQAPFDHSPNDVTNHHYNRHHYNRHQYHNNRVYVDAYGSPTSQVTNASTTPPQSPPLSVTRRGGSATNTDTATTRQVTTAHTNTNRHPLYVPTTTFNQQQQPFPIRSAMKGQRDDGESAGLARSVTWHKEVERVHFYSPSK
ncbi:hypothetical protein BDF19DRAFT_444893 [Syncephalis fuscata]|nr:hypothetical protein BDF19DRAFT_444893 [Syncephalis fuscata]